MALNDLITVCVTTYNRKELLPITIDSILKQTYINFELIIVDDCSGDGTKELVEKELLKLDKRIKYIKHSENQGLAVARNTAIFNAKGKYFTFIDDDDTWEPNFLSTFVKLAQSYDESYAFCASNISGIKDESVKAIKATLSDLLIYGYTPPVASQFYFTDTVKNIGGYDEMIKSGIDHDLWLTLGLYGTKMVWLNKKLVNNNTIPSSNRITYNVDNRINGIKNSINIWENRIGDSFGKNFFSCFTRNYQYNTYKKFILFKIQKQEYKNLFLYWQKLPKYLFFLDIKRYIFDRLGKQNLLRQATFFSCSESSLDIFSKIEVIRR